MLALLIRLPQLAWIAFVFAREGALHAFDLAPLPWPARLALRMGRLIERRSTADRAARLSAALARLGPSYVKFGQFLATRPDVVGTELARDLERLQDRVPPFGREPAEAAIELALGAPVAALFSSFSDPVAAASIAQVHKATFERDGVTRAVAVKVLRPGVARRFRRDLATFYAIARFAERFVRATRRLKPVAVVDTLARSVALEMDLRLEAAALSEIAENSRHDPGFRVPVVEWTRTARDVLTIDWIDGIPLSDHERLKAAGHDLPALGRIVIQSFLRHAMRDGFFHADMHQGNLFVDAAGNLVAVDFGITGRLGRKERRFLAEILYGFIVRDYRRVAEVHFEAGYVPSDQSVEDFAGALRSIGEPIHARTADQISMARLLTQLFEVTDLFRMQTRPELLLLQKTMVVVEGVGRSLDPKLDLWSTADPVVRGWIADNLGAAGMVRNAAEAASQLGRGLVGLPTLLNRAERLAERLEAASERVAQDREERPRHNLRAPLWTIAVALAVIAVALLAR